MLLFSYRNRQQIKLHCQINSQTFIKCIQVCDEIYIIRQENEIKIDVPSLDDRQSSP